MKYYFSFKTVPIHSGYACKSVLEIHARKKAARHFDFSQVAQSRIRFVRLLRLDMRVCKKLLLITPDDHTEVNTELIQQ